MTAMLMVIKHFNKNGFYDLLNEVGPHRLAAQDIGLSRRKRGFDSRWGHQSILAIKTYRKPGNNHFK